MDDSQSDRIPGWQGLLTILHFNRATDFQRFPKFGESTSHAVHRCLDEFADEVPAGLLDTLSRDYRANPNRVVSHAGYHAPTYLEIVQRAAEELLTLCEVPDLAPQDAQEIRNRLAAIDVGHLTAGVSSELRALNATPPETNAGFWQAEVVTETISPQMPVPATAHEDPNLPNPGQSDNATAEGDSSSSNDGREPRYLNLIVDETRGEVRREGYNHGQPVTFDIDSAEWQTFLPALRAGERGATASEWKKAYQGEWEYRRKTKSRCADKLAVLEIGFESHALKLTEKPLE